MIRGYCRFATKRPSSGEDKIITEKREDRAAAGPIGTFVWPS